MSGFGESAQWKNARDFYHHIRESGEKWTGWWNSRRPERGKCIEGFPLVNLKFILGQAFTWANEIFWKHLNGSSECHGTKYSIGMYGKWQ